ncbi:unnamed protein product [Cylicocyclus nassatus]|uniref:Uncharacterized protein n=1 Tax=Cylicocyclus nassatus TaxID=53992 RepID=A0AA36H1D0_CYLNA|nr:unnamed protein product [Cylicocyclus nassatus]
MSSKFPRRGSSVIQDLLRALNVLSSFCVSLSSLPHMANICRTTRGTNKSRCLCNRLDVIVRHSGSWTSSHTSRISCFCSFPFTFNTAMQNRTVMGTTPARTQSHPRMH